MRRVPAFDMPLLFCFLILVGLGIAFVYTASYPRAMSESGGSSFAFAGKQLICAVIGLAAMFICMYTPLELFRRHIRTIGIALACLLLLVLLVGAAKHGNRAWIELGPVQFQPSEFAKVGLVLILAAYLAKRPWSVRSLRGLFTGPYLILGGMLGLILLQGDLGTVTVIALGCILLLAVAGAKFRYWGLPMMCLLLLASLVVMTGHKAARIEAWRDPFNSKVEASDQPRNSLIAVGSGGFVGRGFCMSRQKWFYLPGSHNDYILAVIAEELGFVGTLVFIFVPYLFMLFRGFTIAHRAPDEFSALVAAGCTIMLGVQAMVNMCVVTNMIPCMGITLPFISYGGTSLIASMVMAGLLLNVSGVRLGARAHHTIAPTEQSVAG